MEMLPELLEEDAVTVKLTDFELAFPALSFADTVSLLSPADAEMLLFWHPGRLSTAPFKSYEHIASADVTKLSRMEVDVYVVFTGELTVNGGATVSIVNDAFEEFMKKLLFANTCRK